MRSSVAEIVKQLHSLGNKVERAGDKLSPDEWGTIVDAINSIASLAAEALREDDPTPPEPRYPWTSDAGQEA